MGLVAACYGAHVRDGVGDDWRFLFTAAPYGIISMCPRGVLAEVPDGAKEEFWGLISATVGGGRLMVRAYLDPRECAAYINASDAPGREMPPNCVWGPAPDDAQKLILYAADRWVNPGDELVYEYGGRWRDVKGRRLDNAADMGAGLAVGPAAATAVAARFMALEAAAEDADEPVETDTTYYGIGVRNGPVIGEPEFGDRGWAMEEPGSLPMEYHGGDAFEQYHAHHCDPSRPWGPASMQLTADRNLWRVGGAVRGAISPPIVGEELKAALERACPQREYFASVAALLPRAPGRRSGRGAAALVRGEAEVRHVLTVFQENERLIEVDERMRRSRKAWHDVINPPPAPPRPRAEPRPPVGGLPGAPRVAPREPGGGRG